MEKYQEVMMFIPGAVIMGVGSLVFMLPHFIAESHIGSTITNSSSDNICRTVSVREQDMGLGRLSSGKLLTDYFYFFIVKSIKGT